MRDAGGRAIGNQRSLGLPGTESVGGVYCPFSPYCLA
jgi:hypothetical protein